MPMYIQKVVAFEAIRWHKHSDHPKVRMLYRKMTADETCPKCQELMRNHGWLDRPLGGCVVCPGDYIFGDKAMSPSEFEVLYEKV